MSLQTLLPLFRSLYSEGSTCQPQVFTYLPSPSHEDLEIETFGNGHHRSALWGCRQSDDVPNLRDIGWANLTLAVVSIALLLLESHLVPRNISSPDINVQRRQYRRLGCIRYRSPQLENRIIRALKLERSAVYLFHRIFLHSVSRPSKHDKNLRGRY